MKWLSKLLKKPDAKPSVPSNPATAKSVKPADDSERLRGALAAAADEGERSRLSAQLGRALAGQARAPQAEDSPEVWVAAICHAPDKVLALTWLAGLEGDAHLGEVATQALGAEVRFAAARRIETNAVLEHVAQASRDKDKRVYRHCADLLRQRRLAETSARRALEIAGELRGLLDAAPLPVTPLLDLKKELATLGVAGKPGEECNALLEQTLTRLQQEAEARRDLQLNQSAAVALAAECASAAWPWNEQLTGWRVRLDTLSQASAGLPPWLADQASARALGESLAEIESRLATLVGDDERAISCEQFLAPLEAGAQPDAGTAAAWDALAKPARADARQVLESRWQALGAYIPPVAVSEPAPAAPPRAKPRVDHDAVRELLDKLEQTIEQGHLIDADAIAKQIKSTPGGDSLRGALESRWHSLQAQLEQLRGWARWGTGQAREQLIAAAAELLNGDRDVAALARAIPALREEWKRLNTHGAAAKGQWESFDTTLEKAYQPVAARRAEEAALQAAARAAKEALCADWEAEVAGIVWDQADLKVIETRHAEMIKQWRATPLAGFRDERGLRKRFDTLIGGIEQHLNAARAAELERREQLIAEAEALSEQTDLGRAMTEAKALQARWNHPATPVRLKRRDEEKQWKRFRAACDDVFGRRDAERAEQATQRQEQTRSRQLLLDTFASTLTGADANGIKQALLQFRADWNAGKPATRDAVDRLEKQARDLQQQAQQLLDDLRNKKHLARFELLALRAALAERIEAAAHAAEPLEAIVAEAKQAWDGLPKLPGKVESLLAQRFAGASSVTHAELTAGRETREALLLDLEIALGLPSPETHAEARRKRQLERLQNRFGAVAPQSLEAETLLTRWYATAALPDAVFDRRIAAVVRQLAEQIAPDNGS
ncbi:MAG: DUF349 domain-containing protein [Gallionellaceae bacterium]|nr:DUF349 domain-containing protein [Gallionellaceae bacterium]